VSNDLDEVFEPGWRQKLENAWNDEITRAKYWFAWSHNADGTVAKKYPMEKIHRRKDFKWVHPVHEILEYSGNDADRTVWVNNIMLHHYPDLSKPRSQYLPLLEMSVKENPDDDRTMFWLGREYYYHENYDTAIRTLKKHLSMPAALWNEERSASMRYIAECYRKKGILKEEKSWLFRALAECSDVREPYLYLVRFGYREKNWPLVYAMAVNGLSIKFNSGSYLVLQESWGSDLYDFGAIAAYNIGLYEKARELELKAIAMNPKDERLKTNFEFIQERCKRDEDHE
jgi:tetratricopeptide (TPR) repeat protein